MIHRVFIGVRAWDSSGSCISCQQQLLANSECYRAEIETFIAEIELHIQSAPKYRMIATRTK